MTNRVQSKPTVAIIGLGAMGAALARSQIAAGYQTVVWNRSTAKVEALVKDGAIAAGNAPSAVEQSELVLICLDTYANAEAVLESALTPGTLADKVIVQLGTSTPEEARAFGEKIHKAGGQALDGALMFYPDAVGPENSNPFLIAGDAEGYDRAVLCLRQISKNLMHMGDNLGAPSAMDLSLLTISATLYAGIAHAAQLCEAEGASLNVLAELCPHGPRARERLEIIAKDAYALNSLHDGGSLSVWAGVAKHLDAHAKAAALNADLPQFLNALYRRATPDFGDQDVAALVKLLRESQPE